MKHVRMVKNKFSSSRRTPANSVVAVDGKASSAEDPPQLSLSDAETRLNMHQHNGLPEASSPPDKQNGGQNGGQNGVPDSAARSLSPPSNGAEPTGSEWSSAVGHAMTGKSGRVIHNLQEDIARLTRECSLQRSRAEETLRINEVLKQQLDSFTDRLQNLEQSHEADLNSIARKDRKIDDLKAELQSERNRRQKAEDDARRTDQIAAQERDEHHRALTEAQETAHHARSQYDALVRARSREQGEYQTRFGTFRKELDELCERERERQNRLSRLDVIIEQKNRELEAGKERMEQHQRLFREYKEHSDGVLRELVDSGKRNDAEIDRVTSEATKVSNKMKWALNVKDNVADAQ